MAPMVLAALTPPEHSFTYLDEDIDEIRFDRIDADLIAITAMTVQADRAYFLADKFRLMGYPVVIGGIHASSCPEEASMHADAVCMGEADNYWASLLEDFASGQLKKRYNAKEYPPVINLISPKIDVVRHSSYSVLPLQATKGCPYQCDFCCIKFSSGNKYRMKPVEQVVEEIKAYERFNKGILKKRYHFNDDNLYVNREYTIKLFKALRDLNIQWMGMGSFSTALDREVVKLMAESGCRNYGMGLESVSAESLHEVNKVGNKIDDYKKATQMLISHGIIPTAYFIVGFDSDDESTFGRTVDFLIENHIINPLLQIMTPFPGTKVYERLKDRIFDKKWSHYGSQKCVFAPKKLTALQLESGFYWAAHQLAELSILKEHLKYFWSHGPWEKNPRLTLSERLLLMYLAMGLKGNKEYRKFLFWAARQRDAVDAYQIVSIVAFNHMAKKFETSRKKLSAD